MARKGIFGKVFEKVKDRFDGDDERHDAPAERRDENTVGGFVPGVGTVEAAAPSVPGVGTVASADTSGHGQVIGSGLGREYVTREGDTLEQIGAYFYGDAKQAQRLLDDNPELDLRRYGAALPGGLRLKVGEDPNRGDTVRKGGY